MPTIWAYNYSSSNKVMGALPPLKREFSMELGYIIACKNESPFEENSRILHNKLKKGMYGHHDQDVKK